MITFKTIGDITGCYTSRSTVADVLAAVNVAGIDLAHPDSFGPGGPHNVDSRPTGAYFASDGGLRAVWRNHLGMVIAPANCSFGSGAELHPASLVAVAGREYVLTQDGE